MTQDDFTLTDADFTRFSRLVYDKAGIHLHQGKKQLMQSRLGKVLRKRNIAGYREYYELVMQDKSGEEIVELINTISTNVTHFFREEKHFDFMEKQWWQEISTGIHPIRIWSAASSSGEEPYSIAIRMSEICTTDRAWSVLASDISTRMLEIGKKGIYPISSIDQIPLPLRNRYFQKGTGKAEGYIKVRDFLKRQVQFTRINLNEPIVMKEPFDLIFCRNVMIYFNPETKTRIAGNLYKHLRPGGYLFIGHSESLNGLDTPFRYIHPAIYRKEK